ncbi:tRNA epoxyqueuosine(34) reductase QueG [Aedoeadaptatus coxii]|uniref:tRNA epoxyqueuosine(34) reductase QueG n=1 Tax=Aedoeadaptatus coxii TaxID=755172 RepID=UPI002AD250D7|nr:tRNA epoxyqueuosine(34) reductase QueG [Peptoniphilus coxii]
MEIEAIKNRIGFHDVAHIPAVALHEMKAIFEQREQNGRRLPIEPDSVNERIDPRCVLPSARSIVVAFEQTPFAEKMPEAKPGYGRLAGVSRDRDYHHLLGEKLRSLEQALKEEYPELESYLQVDTGPLYERGFAELTGKGFLGRNGLFIHDTLGSYVGIGLLVTNLPGGEIKVSEKKCGDCMKCVRACPGGALSKEGIVDPRRCRSWITQKRGELTEREKYIMGDWLYGCDQCQIVCPKNQGIEHTFQVEDPVEHISLDAIRETSNRTFKESFGHLSGSWRGAKQWKKNADYIDDYFGKDRE